MVALAGSIGLGEWLEAGALVFLFTFAEWLEERCVSRAAGALEDILRLQPETALVVVQAGLEASAADSCCSQGCCTAEAADKQAEQTCELGQLHSDHMHCHQNQHQDQHQHPPCCPDSTCGSSVAEEKHNSCCGHEHSAGSRGCGMPQCAAAGDHGQACCHADHPPTQQHQHGHHHQQQQQQKQKQKLQLLPMPVAQLQAGVLVLVRPGDKVPIDGIIEAGSSVLDESMVTGESKPVSKSTGQAVLAGTVNSGSTGIKVRATAAAGDSTVARLASLMEAAAASKSKHDKAVEAFAKYYTPAVVLAALLTVGVGAAVQPAAWRHWAYLSLVVLVTGCPCALVISTPVASVAGLTRAARRVSRGVAGAAELGMDVLEVMVSACGLMASCAAALV